MSISPNDLTSLHLEALKAVSNADQNDALRANILGHTVAIVTAMIAADAIQSEIYDSETQKAVYLDHPVLDAIQRVHKTLSEVAASQAAQQAA